ncbi:MAG TPA: hypothetical protein VGO11_10005 [Chthoniobacteraceae bacterium]|nr:hypothetical protein [Chthoniobacteraceae bacterium]
MNASSPDAVRLAKQLSLAVSIEPALLRQARIEARPRMDVSVESDLWFSPIVESRSLNGIFLRHEVAVVLRKDFAREAAEAVASGRSDPLESARRRVRRAHRAAPATIRLHEELIWRELTAGGSDVEELLAEIYLRMLADATGGKTFANWFSALAYELPEQARRSPSFQDLDDLSAKMLRRKVRFVRPAEVKEAREHLPGSLLAGLPTTRVWAALTSDALVIQAHEAVGFRPLDLPQTNLLVVDLEVEGKGFQRYYWDPREPFWVRFPGAGITIQTLAGSRIRFNRRRARATAAAAGETGPVEERLTWLDLRRGHPFGEFGRIAAKISIDLDIQALSRAVLKTSPALGRFSQSEWTAKFQPVEAKRVLAPR